MTPASAHCLILACGNTLRGDDGVGPWLAEWIARHFRHDPRVRIISRQQWTPELAADIAQAASVLFLDCSVAIAPGEVHLGPVAPAQAATNPGAHHLDPTALLALTIELYATPPSKAMLLTVGAASTELGEQFSTAVAAALPRACRMIEETVLQLIENL